MDESSQIELVRPAFTGSLPAVTSITECRTDYLYWAVSRLGAVRPVMQTVTSPTAKPKHDAVSISRSSPGRKGRTGRRNCANFVNQMPLSARTIPVGLILGWPTGAEHASSQIVGDLALAIAGSSVFWPMFTKNDWNKEIALKPLSIKWKAALGATALAVALIGIVSAIQVNFLRRDIADVLSAQQFTLATQAAHDLDGKLAASLNALARSADSLPRDILTDPDKVRNFYAQRPAMFVVFDDMLLMRTDGQVIADYPQIAGRTNVNVADRRYFQQVLATGKPVISEPVIGKLRHEPIVNMAAPVLGQDGKVLGVLTGVLRLEKDNILGQLASAKVGKTGRSEERRVGKECAMECRSRWSPYH